jgi:hypothetical protein
MTNRDQAVGDANPRRMTNEVKNALPDRIAEAVADMKAWLRALPAWPKHPTNASGSVSAHFGPTILSEHDCVMHFARFLNQAGVPWEDMHLELAPGQWMYHATASMPRRIDLAVIAPGRLAAAGLPVAPGALPLDAVFEFALASSYWQFGSGSAQTLRTKVDKDVAKVANYLRSGLAARGYVVVIEECDHSFPAAYAEQARVHGVEVLLLQQWCRD